MDEWDSYAVKDQPQTDEWSQYEVKPLAQKAEGMGSLLGGAMGVGAGYGAFKGGQAIKNYLQAPNKLLKPLDIQLEGIQSNFPSLAGTRTQDLPGLLSAKAADYSQNLKRIDTNVKLASSNLNSKISEFNKTVMSKNLDDLAMTAKTGAPKLFESAYESYGTGLDAIDGFMSDKGVSFNNKDISKLIGDIKDKAIRNGVPENRLAIFTKLEEELAPQKLDITKPIKFRNAKSIVDNITRNSDDETRYIAKELWGNLLENKAPLEVKDQLTKINQDYSKFAKARYELNRIAKMKSGEYNTEGLRKFFVKYADDMAQTDKKNLIKLLSEGDDIVQAIPGLKGKVGELGKNVAKKLTLEDALNKIGKVSLEKKQRILQQLNQYNQSATKAQELLSQKAAIAEKFPLRTGGLKKVIGEAGKAAGRGLIFKGLGGLALGALDPTNRVIGDPIEAIERALGQRKLTEEDFRKFQQANMI